MRVDPRAHRERPLLVHRLTRDFELLDVWRLPAESHTPQDNFERFLRVFPLLRPGHGGGSRAMRVLMAVRHVLLAALGLQDDPAARWPIPGCEEHSLRERMSALERERHELTGAAGRLGFVPVYRTHDERLDELSNATVHALMHLSWVTEHGTQGAYLAVYAKPRGPFGRAYMALISPFRHWIVYPAMMKVIARAWQLDRPAGYFAASSSES